MDHYYEAQLRIACKHYKLDHIYEQHKPVEGETIAKRRTRRLRIERELQLEINRLARLKEYAEDGERKMISEALSVKKSIGTNDDIDNRTQYDWNDVDQQSITVNDSKNNTKDSAVSSTSWVHF